MAQFLRSRDIQAREEFPEATCIVLAGDWYAYTLAAKELGRVLNYGRPE